MARLFTQMFRSLVLAAFVLTGVDSVFATLYSVKDLGVLTNLPAHNASEPNAISNNGKVEASNVTNGFYMAFIYGGDWTNLGTLGGNGSFGLGVNDSSQVVGRSITTNGLSHAFLWTPGGSDGVATNPEMKDLGTFAGGTNSEADSINHTGQIAGYA